MHVLPEPRTERGKLAMPKLVVEGSRTPQGHLCSRIQLCGHYCAERVAWEITKSADRPMDILQHSVRVIPLIQLDAQVCRHTCTNHARVWCVVNGSGYVKGRRKREEREGEDSRARAGEEAK